MLTNPIIVLADIAALRAYPKPTNKQLAFLTGSKALYCFDGTITTADDGGTFLKPTVRSTSQKGRWVLDNSQLSAGARAVNVYRLASNVADAETITIGADVYEFKTSGAASGSNIKVDASGGVTPTLMSAALVAAINTSGTEKVTAVAISVNEILVIAAKPGAVILTSSETLAGSNNAWAAAAMYGGSVPGPKKRVLLSRVPLATEVTLGNLHVELDFTATKVKVDVRVTATPGVAVAWDGGVTITAGRVTLDNAGSTDWSASHTIWIEASE